MRKNSVKRTVVLSALILAMTVVLPTPGGNPGVSAHHGRHSGTHGQKNQKNHGKCYLNKKKVNLCMGETCALKLKGAKGKSAWTSSDKSVATVSKKGRIKAIGKGTCRVKCRNKKKVYECRVKVKETSKKSTQNTTPPIENQNKGYNDDNGSLCNYFIKYDMDNILSLSDGTSASCPYQIYRHSLNGVPITCNGAPLSAADLKPGDVLRIHFSGPQKAVYPCPIENIISVEVTDRKPEYAQIKYYYDVLRTDGDKVYIMLSGNEFAISLENDVKDIIIGNYDGKQPDNIVIETGNKIRIIDDNGCDIDPAFFRAKPFTAEIVSRMN